MPLYRRFTSRTEYPSSADLEAPKLRYVFWGTGNFLASGASSPPTLCGQILKVKIAKLNNSDVGYVRSYHSHWVYTEANKQRKTVVMKLSDDAEPCVDLKNRLYREPLDRLARLSEAESCKAKLMKKKGPVLYDLLFKGAYSIGQKVGEEKMLAILSHDREQYFRYMHGLRVFELGKEKGMSVEEIRNTKGFDIVKAMVCQPIDVCPNGEPIMETVSATASKLQNLFVRYAMRTVRLPSAVRLINQMMKQFFEGEKVFAQLDLKCTPEANERLTNKIKVSSQRFWELNCAPFEVNGKLVKPDGVDDPDWKANCLSADLSRSAISIHTVASNAAVSVNRQYWQKRLAKFEKASKNPISRFFTYLGEAGITGRRERKLVTTADEDE